MINCIFAKGVAENYIECRNSAKSHLYQAAQAYCYRCKHRIPVEKEMPPIVYALPHARQMRIEEWLKEE